MKMMIIMNKIMMINMIKITRLIIKMIAERLTIIPITMHHDQNDDD